MVREMEMAKGDRARDGDGDRDGERDRDGEKDGERDGFTHLEQHSAW